MMFWQFDPVKYEERRYTYEKLMRRLRIAYAKEAALRGLILGILLYLVTL